MDGLCSRGFRGGGVRVKTRRALPSRSQARPFPHSMNIRLAILIKLFAVLLFAVMSVLVRFVGETVPLGQVVFFRSVFAILPVVLS
jgi:hypothetical protein